MCDWTKAERSQSCNKNNNNKTIWKKETVKDIACNDAKRYKQKEGGKNDDNTEKQVIFNRTKAGKEV